MKKSKKPRKKPSASMRGPFFAGHPLNGVPQDARRQYAKSVGHQERKKFDDLLPLVCDLISRVDPLHAVALMSTYGLMGTTVGHSRGKRESSSPKVQQGHIEYLQALGLRNQLSKASEFPESDSIQKLFDWLPELFGAYQKMRAGTRIPPSESDPASQEPDLTLIQEFLRGHTSVVRNWGYFGNVTRISKELFSRIDDEYERKAGMKLTKIVDIFEGLIRRHEDKVNEYRVKIHNIFQHKTVETMLDAFFNAFEFKGEVEEFRNRLCESGVTLRQAMFALLPLAGRHLGTTFIVTDEEIATTYEVNLNAVSKLTARLSLAPGALADQAPESLFLNNPVWLQPLIKMQKGAYFCALPQTLMSFVLPIADELLKPFESLQEQLSGVKASYLEDEVFRLFENAFPGAKFHRGFKWREGSVEYESDLVIRFDTTLVLVEAKSGRVTWPALRGAPDRLIEHIKKLIVEPSDQSGRLAQRIEDDIARIQAAEASTLNFPLSLEGVTCVVRLSVTLHDFATLQSIPAMLADAGVLKNKFPLAPCMSLADLEVMFDLLSTNYVRLHYLRRRAELLMSIKTFGDELDMLGLYLDTCFNLGALQTSTNNLITAGYSAKIDHYYTSRGEGVVVRKPKSSVSDWFTRLCEQLQKRSRPGWSEIACALLAVAFIDQQQLERQISALASRVRSGKLLENGQDTVLLIPPQWISHALAFQVKRRDGPGPYGSHAENIAQQAFEAAHVKRCGVIVVDAQTTDLPYLSIGIFTSLDVSGAIFLPAKHIEI